MDLVKFYRESGVSAINKALRLEEESILQDLRPRDIYTAQVAYRLACRMTQRMGRVPAYAELPKKLIRGETRHATCRLSREEYAEMSERIELVIMDLAMPPIQPVEEVMYPGSDSDLERARRVSIYADQFDRIERRFGTMVDEVFKTGSKGREVWCDSSTGRQVFQSIRSAAIYASNVSGQSIYRAAIRFAIDHHSDLHGMRFGFTGYEAQCRTGRERPVRCLTTGQDFDNLGAASRHFGYDAQRISNAIKSNNGLLGDLRFEFADEQHVYAMAG